MCDLTSSVSGSRTSSCMAVQPLFFKPFSRIAGEAYLERVGEHYVFLHSIFLFLFSWRLKELSRLKYINVAILAMSKTRAVAHNIKHFVHGLGIESETRALYKDKSILHYCVQELMPYLFV